jgi:solute carrier family 25 protein 44
MVKTDMDIGLHDTSQVQIIEWSMLDKKKFIPLNVCTTAAVRAFLYPLTVVKTRIQVTKRNAYRGTIHALLSIAKHEGFRGLYSGYLISTFQVFSGLVYTSTYEGIRHVLMQNRLTGSGFASFMGGLSASATALLLVVPSDIVSQHMMVFSRRRLLNNDLTKPAAGVVTSTAPSTSANAASLVEHRNVDALNIRKLLQREPNGRIWWLITRQIYRQDGLIGFYRGYPASVLCYGPSNGALWFLYVEFASQFYHILPDRSHLMAQSLAAPCAGAVVAVLFNSVDLFRANLQVQRNSWSDTAHRLWHEEGWRIFTKGLPTRLAIMPTTTFLMLGSYEWVKRNSVHSELLPMVHW